MAIVRLIFILYTDILAILLSSLLTMRVARMAGFKTPGSASTEHICIASGLTNKSTDMLLYMVAAGLNYCYGLL